MEEGIPVRFIYNDLSARRVCVSGSFNGWSDQSHCMDRSPEAWTLEMRLPRGRHLYLLVIDGKNWQEDPGAFLSEDNGFGGRNSVLILE